MCGIAGVAGPGAVGDADVVARMLDALVHRGPDAGGVDKDAACVLGHRRLSIVDLVTGDQPLRNETGTVRTVVNGEIYNHEDVRRRLSGHRWATASDCEAIVHLYEEHGPGFVERLRGMFAIALWDAERRRLVLARDRFGKKPLYWCLRAGRLVFASELGALVQHPAVGTDPDPVALDLYFGLQYVPAPRTAFADVWSLEPGHVLVFEGGGVTTDRYWTPPFDAPRPGWSFAEAAERIRETVDEAVRVRLMSDVPLGAFLSGGIDSSAVVASMARQTSAPVKTFTIGFEEDRFDERPYARMVAERWGTEHHEFVVRQDAVDVLPTIVEHHGQPFADSSALPTHYVAELTRGSVTVALSGDGGDEVFGGYERYSAALLAEVAGRAPASLMRGSARALALAGRVHSKAARTARRMARFAEGGGMPVDAAYVQWMSHFSIERKRWLYGPELLGVLRGGSHDRYLRDVAGEAAGLDTINRLTRLDMLSYLPYDLLAKVDIASMTHSLEVRCPLLDQELADAVAPLPGSWKADRLRRKRLLRAAFERDIPREVMRRPKRGFGVPIHAWLRGPLGDLARDRLCSADAPSSRWVRREAVTTLLDEHVAGRADHAYLLWNLLVFDLWLRRFVEPAR